VPGSRSERRQKERRADNLLDAETQTDYLAELASAQGVVDTLGSPVLRPVLAGVQTNLYMVFMDTVWSHLSSRGTAGLLHPESHFTDPKGAALRRATYGHLRRHWQKWLVPAPSSAPTSTAQGLTWALYKFLTFRRWKRSRLRCCMTALVHFRELHTHLAPAIYVGTDQGC